MAYLLVYQDLPVERAAGLLGDVLGARMATGTLAGVVAEGAAGLDGVHPDGPGAVGRRWGGAL